MVSYALDGGDEPTDMLPQRVRCAECGREVDEDEAQAQRWGYHWSELVDKLYPYCPECAQRKHAG